MAKNILRYSTTDFIFFSKATRCHQKQSHRLTIYGSNNSAPCLKAIGRTRHRLLRLHANFALKAAGTYGCLTSKDMHNCPE